MPKHKYKLHTGTSSSPKTTSPSPKTTSPSIKTGLFLASTLLATTALTGAAMFTTRTTNATDNWTDEVNIEVPIACSMGNTPATDVAHTATLMNGTYSGTYIDGDNNTPYANGIGATALTTFCNDQNGFSIYAIGFTNDTAGNNTLEGANTHITIPTGIYNSSTTTNSLWSMKITAGTDSGDTTNHPLTIDSAPNEEGGSSVPFSSYHVVPDTYTKIAHKDAATAMTGTPSGATITTTYDAYISTTQAADTYTGKVKYVMVHPYDHAAPDIPTGTSCTTPVPNLTYMQDLNSSNKASVLSSMTEDQQYFLKDKRDEKSYCVAKLKDGNIWMTQNLDHDIKTDGTVTYDNTTTDLGWNTSTNSYDTATWTPSLATYTTGTTTWNYSYTTPESYDPGNQYWTGSPDNGSGQPSTQETCTAVGGIWDSESEYCGEPDTQETCEAAGAIWNADNNYCESFSFYTSSTGDSHYHLGNYYNWTAAVATNDSSTYGAYNDQTGEYENLQADQSICPAGWTLPRVGEGEDTFKALWDEYNFSDRSFIDTNENYTWDSDETALWTSPLYFAPSGYWDGGLYNVGGSGGFWSPVVGDDDNAYGAGFGVGGDVYPSGGGYRDYGYSVRCVARPVASSVTGLDG